MERFPMRSTKPRGGRPKAAGLRLLLRLVLAAAVAGSLSAISISVSGSWSTVIDVSDLQGGAGTNLVPSQESPLNGSSLTVSQASGLNWQVSVRKIDGTWPSGLGLAVERTSNGSGSGSIAGGTAYLTVTSTDQSFFTGRGNRSTVYLRFQLSGLSVNIPPSTYSTTVIYTVVQTN
jgi:hypothetical protein